MKEIYTIIATRTIIIGGEIVENKVVFIQTWDSMDKAITALFRDYNPSESAEDYVNMPDILINATIDTAKNNSVVEIRLGETICKVEAKIFTSELLS
jgi:hypothetical protein